MDKFPEIIVHLSLIKSFLPEAAEICHRALYVNILEGAKDFIIQKHPSNNTNNLNLTCDNPNNTTHDQSKIIIVDNEIEVNTKTSVVVQPIDESVQSTIREAHKNVLTLIEK